MLASGDALAGPPSVTDHGSAVRAWIVDPISYSGMAYSDLGLAGALRERGVDALLVGSDRPLLSSPDVPVLPLFVGSHPGSPRWRRGFAHGRSLIRLMVAAMRARPDIVHWEYLQVPPLDLLSIAALGLFRIPVVFTAHEADPWATGRIRRATRRLVYSASRAVVVHNPETKSTLIAAYGVPAAKISVIELGDYRRFADPAMDRRGARARLALPDQAPIALFFGSLRPAKGLDLLLDAWPQVVVARPEALLLVAGSPSRQLEAEVLTRRIEALGIESSVRTVLREVDPAEANAFYRAADVVVLPYREIGTSGVMRYAFSSGRPVVATAIGEQARHIRPDATGWPVPPGDRDAMASTLAEALGDRAAAHTLGERALAYARDTFDWSRSAEATEALYRTLLGPGR